MVFGILVCGSLVYLVVCWVLVLVCLSELFCCVWLDWDRLFLIWGCGVVGWWWRFLILDVLVLVFYWYKWLWRWCVWWGVCCLIVCFVVVSLWFVGCWVWCGLLVCWCWWLVWWNFVCGWCWLKFVMNCCCCCLSL